MSFGEKEEKSEGKRGPEPANAAVPDLAVRFGYTRASDVEDTSSALSRSKISLARDRSALFSV